MHWIGAETTGGQPEWINLEHISHVRRLDDHQLVLTTSSGDSLYVYGEKQANAIAPHLIEREIIHALD